MTSVNYGQKETYASEGIEKLEWLSTVDNDTRPDHLECNGQIRGIDEPFDVGGESMQYPGDPAGGAGNVCNCRCTVLPVIKGAE